MPLCMCVWKELIPFIFRWATVPHVYVGTPLSSAVFCDCTVHVGVLATRPFLCQRASLLLAQAVTVDQLSLWLWAVSTVVSLAADFRQFTPCAVHWCHSGQCRWFSLDLRFLVQRLQWNMLFDVPFSVDIDATATERHAQVKRLH